MVKRTDRRREMERLLSRREREGLSLRALADETGIPVGTLSWWSHRLREESRPAFREVRVTDDAGDGVSAMDRETTSRSQSGAVRVQLPGGVLAEFEGEFAEQVLEILFERLRRWC